MATITLTVPGGMADGTKLHSFTGSIHTVAGGTVTVDTKTARSLQKIGFTAATLPNMDDQSPTKTRSMNAPAGSNLSSINVSGGPSVPVVAGVAVVPLNLVPSLVEAGFTV